ncbi:hypothetical protein [Priestia megaterium]|uniref:hypothetical protein n=1 Tax=Priestia megaterium TaxID=1404 RepID=UPI00211BB0C5|nr:hypothetical protein [Priestia megaterium]
MAAKHVNIHITDHKGSILDKSTVFLKDEDTLVVKMPEGTSIEQSKRVHEQVKKCLSEDCGPLVISNQVELLVIKKVVDKDE